MTSLIVFHRAGASGTHLVDALTRAGVSHERTVVDGMASADTGGVQLVCIEQESRAMTVPPEPRTALACATQGEHRFLLNPVQDAGSRFALAESLLPDNPRTRHRIALHSGAMQPGLPRELPADAGDLPAHLITDGAAALRTRLRQLADMQTTHVIGRARTATDLAVIARAASDCALAVGDVDFLMQLLAYRRVRGWLQFQRKDTVTS